METDTADAVLARRIDALEDRQAIVDRLYALAHAIDYGDEDGFVDCFTADAVFSVFRREETEPLRESAGHTGLRAMVERHTRPPELYHKHLYLNPLVRLDGDSAEVDVYFVLLAEHDGEPTPLAFGRDRDRLVREHDGQWRIARRRVEMEVRSAVPVWTLPAD